MPALPAVPNVLKITLRGSITGDTDVLNRFFLEYAGSAPTNAELNTLCAAVAAAAAAHYLPLLSNDYTLHEVIAIDLSSSTGAEGTATVADTGGVSTEVNPAGTSAVVQFHVARRYRGGHPRIYLPAIPGTWLSSSTTWDATHLAAFLTAWNAFMTAVVALTWSGATISGQVNVSFYQGFTNVTFPSGRIRAVPKVRSTPVVDLIASTSMNPNPASQRRRNQQL